MTWACLLWQTAQEDVPQNERWSLAGGRRQLCNRFKEASNFSMCNNETFICWREWWKKDGWSGFAFSLLSVLYWVSPPWTWLPREAENGHHELLQSPQKTQGKEYRFFTVLLQKCVRKRLLKCSDYYTALSTVLENKISFSASLMQYRLKNVENLFERKFEIIWWNANTFVPQSFLISLQWNSTFSPLRPIRRARGQKPRRNFWEFGLAWLRKTILNA